MSSNITPSTTSHILRSSASKTKQDAPPVNAGKHAAAATPGRDDNLARDALPTSQGWYAMPAITGCDDEPMPESPF